jgi:hypothetical protein
MSIALAVLGLLAAPAHATPDPVPSDTVHRFVGFDANGQALVAIVSVSWQLDYELGSGAVEPTGPIAETRVACLVVRPGAGVTQRLDAKGCRAAAPRFDRGRFGAGETVTVGITPADDPVWMRVKDGRALAWRPENDEAESGKLVQAEVVGIEKEAQLLRVPMAVADAFGNPVEKAVWAILSPDLPTGEAATCLSVRPGTRGSTTPPTTLAAIQEAVGARWLVRGAEPVRNTRTEPELLYQSEVLQPYASQVREQLKPMVAVHHLKPFPEAECPLTLILP